MIRILVVDDVAFMRIAIRRMIEAEPGMTVVGEARTGVEAVSLAQSLVPDAITMDIEMPGMDGLEATSAILASVSPRPAIIMVSATTQQGAAHTVEALRRGAVDFVPKSSLVATVDLAQIDTRLRTLLRAWTGRHPPAPAPALAPVAALRRSPDLVVVGASTGGPQALGTLLRLMGPILPPVAIALHMPPFFTAGLAALLAGESGLDVREAVANAQLAPGSVQLVPGGQHATVVRGLGGFRLLLAPATGGIAPSIDQLFQSAARAATYPAAVLLTGMGRDGCVGARALHDAGAPVLVQSPAECVVAGMPEAAIAAGAASAVRPIAGIAAWLAASAGRRAA